MSISFFNNYFVRIIKRSLKKNFGLKNFKGIDFSLTEVPNPKMGDLAFPCFLVAKFLNSRSKKDISPVEIANTLANTIIIPNKYFKKTRAIGPYLNFFLQREKFFEIICQDDYRLKTKIRKKKIMLEFSSPNTNKPLHLGHLRNIVLGMSIANLLEVIGFKVIKANLINDRGIHICKSMLAYQCWKRRERFEDKRLKGDHLVGKYYTMFEERAKVNPYLIEEAQEMLRKWEKGDKKVLALWKKMNSLALKGFEETYKRLSISFDKWYFESKIYKLGRKIILNALKKKKCYRRLDGAIEIDLGQGKKKVLIRPDGTSVYITQDIGLAKFKFDQYKLDKSIYLTGQEQEYHFQILFKILKRIGFSWAKKCEHLSHGMVFLPEGRMKSREGKVVEADELLDKMERMAQEEIIKRQEKISFDKKPEDRTKKIALSALKFYLLKFNPKQAINFNPKESLSLEAATGPYINYAYVRIQSILRKSRAPLINKKKSPFSMLGNFEEWELAKILFRFSKIVEKSALSYNPSYLAEHLLKLATAFNKFYEKHSVLSAKTLELSEARLILVQVVATILKKGMELLKIEMTEKM